MHEKGDIVLKMGEIDVNDMMSYMQALSKFNKGDSTMVKLNRDSKIIEIEITFQWLFSELLKKKS